jgi:hypothetical protein
VATVYLKRGTWYIGYVDALGQRKLQATKAKTKTEAKNLALELEQKVQRQRLGLEAIPSQSTMTLAELCWWWLKHRCNPERVYLEQKRLQRHVLDSLLGAIPLPLVTTAAIEDQLRKMLAEGLSPWTAHGVRRVLGTVYNRARKAGVWNGPNPVADTEAPRIPRKVQRTLKFSIGRADPARMKRGAVCCTEASSYTRTSASALRSAFPWCHEPVLKLDPEPREHPTMWPRAMSPRARLVESDDADSTPTPLNSRRRYGGTSPSLRRVGCAQGHGGGSRAVRIRPGT